MSENPVPDRIRRPGPNRAIFQKDFPQFDGARLRKLRYAADMSQSELAYAAGVSVTTISRVECGANTPSLPTVQLIARALKIPVEVLVDGKVPRSKRS